MQGSNGLERKLKNSCETWHDSGLEDSTKHLMCTLLDKMELVDLGQRTWVRHRIWLGQHGQATEFRISQNVEAQ